MADPIDVLSGSSINTFYRCPKQWEFAYVYRIKRPPRLKMALGLAAHTAVEADLKPKIWTGQDLPQDDVLDVYSTEFDKEAEDAEEEKNLTKGQAKDNGVRTLKVWHKDVAPTVSPWLVEEPIGFEVNGIPWTGTIDLVDTDARVRDWKFTGKTPSSADAYILNMVGYAIGFRVATGTIEKQIILDHMVTLKEPKHVQIKSDGPVPDQSIETFTDMVMEAQRAIEAGIFPATGIKSGACSWCGYRDICPAYKNSPLATRSNTDA